MSKEDQFWAELSKDDCDMDRVLQLAAELGYDSAFLQELAAAALERAAEIYAGAAEVLQTQMPANVIVH